MGNPNNTFNILIVNTCVEWRDYLFGYDLLFCYLQLALLIIIAHNTQF